MSISAHIMGGMESWANKFPGGSEAEYLVARAGLANFGSSSTYGQSGSLTPYGDEISSLYSVYRIYFSFEIPSLPFGALGIESASISWQNSSYMPTPDFDTVAVAMSGEPFEINGEGDFATIWGYFTDIVYGTTHEGWSPSIAINSVGLSAIALGGVFSVGIRTSLDILASTPPNGTANGAQKDMFSFPALTINYLYSTPPIEPTVTTLPATDLNWFKKSATFNGTSEGVDEVYFKWGTVLLERDSIRIPAKASFSVYLHGAGRDRDIYFQAVGVKHHIYANDSYTYGEVLTFELVQTEAAPAYVTKLIIRGQPLIPLETMTLFAKDAASIALYGKRSYSMSTQFSLSQDDTQVILNEILADNKAPRMNDLIVTFQSLKLGALKDAVIAADISTRITLINTLLGINGDFFINNVKHTIVEAGLSYAVQWRLERVYETTPAP